MHKKFQTSSFINKDSVWEYVSEVKTGFTLFSLIFKFETVAKQRNAKNIEKMAREILSISPKNIISKNQLDPFKTVGGDRF